jgi:hypothetical protein
MPGLRIRRSGASVSTTARQYALIVLNIRQHGEKVKPLANLNVLKPLGFPWHPGSESLYEHYLSISRYRCTVFFRSCNLEGMEWSVTWERQHLQHICVVHMYMDYTYVYGLYIWTIYMYMDYTYVYVYSLYSPQIPTELWDPEPVMHVIYFTWDQFTCIRPVTLSPSTWASLTRPCWDQHL